MKLLYAGRPTGSSSRIVAVIAARLGRPSTRTCVCGGRLARRERLDTLPLPRESAYGAVVRCDPRRAAAARIEIAAIFRSVAEEIRAPDRSAAVRLDVPPFGIERDARGECRARAIVRAMERRRTANRACEDARTIGRQCRRPMLVPPLAKLAFIDTQNSAEHGSAADELAALHGRDRARVRAVAIVEVAIASRVHVRDVRVVHDDRVRDVHVADVARRVPIPRNVDLARTEREPADTAAEGDGDADVRAPDPTDERGCINGPVVPRPWNPAPSLAHVRPSAVVKRRETPRGVIDPSPPPG